MSVDPNPPTLLDLIAAACAVTESSEEAAVVINHMLATGSVRLPALERRIARRPSVRS